MFNFKFSKEKVIVQPLGDKIVKEPFVPQTNDDAPIDFDTNANYIEMAKAKKVAEMKPDTEPASGMIGINQNNDPDATRVDVLMKGQVEPDSLYVQGLDREHRKGGSLNDL